MRSRTRSSQDVTVRREREQKSKPLLGFIRQTHFVSRPLNGVFDDRRERFQRAERDLLFWGVSLNHRKRHVYEQN